MTVLLIIEPATSNTYSTYHPLSLPDALPISIAPPLCAVQTAAPARHQRGHRRMADRLRRRGGRRYALGHGRSGRGGRAAVRRAVPRRRIFPVTDRGRPRARREIGRASCRDRVCQYVSISVVDVSIKKKQKTTTDKQ